MSWISTLCNSNLLKTYDSWFSLLFTNSNLFFTENYADTANLLSADNINQEKLFEYAREAADYATEYQMPHLDFAVNHYGKPDVAMFDFTSMYQVWLNFLRN